MSVDDEVYSKYLSDKNDLKVELKSTIENDVLDYETTWKDLGLHNTLIETLESLKYNHPTKIQKEVIPYALKDHDIIGIAQTGSGKTAAFVLPILNALLQTRPSPCSALILSPTRELSLVILNNSFLVN
jgi:ATP-dependent RNA helicase DDX47/RRP3